MAAPVVCGSPHPIDAENMCKHSALDRIFSPQRQHLTGECDMLVR